MESAITVLLFEDEPLVAMFVQEALESEGFKIKLACDPQAASLNLKPSDSSASWTNIATSGSSSNNKTVIALSIVPPGPKGGGATREP